MKKNSIPRNVIVLGIVSLFTDAATEMIYPLLPLFIATLGSGAILLGIIEGVAETTASLLKLISGVVSDKLGKRKALVVIGYTISSLARPLIGIVSDAWQITLIRTMDRIGKGIRTSPRDALIASSVNEHIRGKAYGFHRAMDHAGAVLGPILCIGSLAILILAFNFSDLPTILRATFLLAIIPGALAVLTLVLFVKENNDGFVAEKKFSFSLRSFDRNFKRYLFITALFTLGNSSDAFMLFRIQETMHNSETLRSIIMSVPLLNSMVSHFGDTQTQNQFANILFLPLIWSFFHIIKVIFSTPLGSLSDRVGRKLVINIGWGIYAAVYIGFALIDQLPEGWQIAATFILFAFYAVYYAFTEGAEKAFVADVVSPQLRGSAFGLFNFAVGIAALPASILFGIIYNAFGATAAFGSGAGIAFVSMILFTILVKEVRRI
ncbi:MAG: MFS transporter [Bacteroidota bacterium]